MTQPLPEQPLPESINELLVALGNAGHDQPVATFKLILGWIEMRVVSQPCRCRAKDCPSHDLSQLLGQIHAYLERDRKREAEGKFMQGYTSGSGREST